MNIYEMVTNKVIEALKNGVISWHKPWTGDGGFVSHTSGNPYSVINQILLISQGGVEGEYLTLKQCNDEGGRVKKGAKGKLVVFYKVVNKYDKSPDDEESEDMQQKLLCYRMLKHYFVFHISDCEGITPKHSNDTTKVLDPIESAESVINDYVGREKLNFKNQETSSKAFFSPSKDLVQVPCLTQYKDVEEYYSTTFHELVHSTGIASRCNRGLESCAAFGSETYSKEELVAEIGSSMCIHRLNINSEKAFKNSAAYIAGWLKALKNDNHMILFACAKAEKAVKYIFNDKEEE